MSRKILLLAGDWDTTVVVYHFLGQHFEVCKVVVEQPVSRKEFLKRRAKSLGWLTVGGQVLFSLVIAKPLALFSKSRIAEILQSYRLISKPIPEEKTIQVQSVNALETITTLLDIAPDLVIVHGTRIISKKVLAAVSCPFINIHAGITPKYRGSHGAYWALANNDNENCGVTVHLVDAGIDTGNILAQGTIPFTAKDNFATYPYLQLAEGLQLLKKYLENGEKTQLKYTTDAPPSALWHHPTLWGYLKTWLIKGVK